MNMLWGIGNPTLMDDGVGIWIAKMAKRMKPSGWLIYDTGTTPENFIPLLRRYHVKLLVIIDALDSGDAPGSISILAREEIAPNISFTSHGTPLRDILGITEEYTAKNIVVGIQPKKICVGVGLTNVVRTAAKKVVRIILSEKIELGSPL